ncbi:MAG: GAF domain-containing protein, partial [Gaiellales bacterium]
LPQPHSRRGCDRTLDRGLFPPGILAVGAGASGYRPGRSATCTAGTQAKENGISELAQTRRLQQLVETGIALSTELSLDDLLQRIVEAARALTGARYGALGVLDQSRARLDNFVTSGVDAETHAEIGDPPLGRGLLGALIEDARPLRLRNIAEDPRSVGFPPAHPPMTSFLGVPILVRGQPFGNLYLTDKDGDAEFTDEDETLVQLLASQAGVAIENSRLYEAARRWGYQLESLIGIGDELAGQTDERQLLVHIVDRLRQLLEARLAFLALTDRSGDLQIEAVAGIPPDDIVGFRLDRWQSKAGRLLQRRRGERIDSVVDDPEIDQELARRHGGTTGLMVPLLSLDMPIGILAAFDRQGANDRFSDDDQRIAELFAARAAAAVDLSRRVERDTLRRTVRAQESERRRLARELHDETGQVLTSIVLGIGAVKDAETMEGCMAAADRLREQATAALEDVRRLAFELRPKALDDFGLEPALTRLVEDMRDRIGVAIDLEANLGDRLPEEVEGALYRTVQESLTNVVKHAGARRVSLLVTRRGPNVVAIVEDDGSGFSPEEVGRDHFGLFGMRERLALLGGELTVESSPGQGTTVRASVPVEPAPKAL